MGYKNVIFDFAQSFAQSKQGNYERFRVFYAKIDTQV